MTLRLTTTWLIVALSMVPAGCSKENVVSVSGNGTGTGGDTSGGTLPDCAADTGTPPGSGGGPMVPAGRTDGTCFWIDTMEVSRGEYETFLASSPSIADHQAKNSECTWNDSFDPDATCEANPKLDPTAADLPIVCVDWCDALAYCQAIGRTLCDGDPGDPASAMTGSWYSACSHGGTRRYPYDSDYNRQLCNGMDFAAAGEEALRPAHQQTGCATPEGILNLSGNAAEWIDECSNNSGASDNCARRGGSFLSDAKALLCDNPKNSPRSTTVYDVGFRCCAPMP
jgi:formylglycine-generating enzyme